MIDQKQAALGRRDAPPMSPGAHSCNRSLNRHHHRRPPRRRLLAPPLALVVLLLPIMTAAAFLFAAPSRGCVFLGGLRHHPQAAAATLLRHYHHRRPHPPTARPPQQQQQRGLPQPPRGRAAAATVAVSAAASTLPDAHHPPRPRNDTASSGAVVVEDRPAAPTLLVVEEEAAAEAVEVEAAADAEVDEAEDEEEGIDALLAPPPADQPRSIRFVIRGDPQPLRRHRVANNRMYNPSAGEQKKFLEQARPFMPPRPLLGPLEATVIFRMKRPRSHYRSGRYAHLLKPDVPRFHTARTDLDNLVKLVLDSLNEHAYEDDRQVVSVRAVKEYCNVGVGSTDVTLRVLEEQEAGAWWEEEGEGGGGAGSVI